MPQSLAEELKSIPMSPNLGASLERAHRFAREQSHRTVALEHLLLALIEDPEAGIILQSANVDLARLGTDCSDYLGRLLEDMRAEPGAEPRPDPELLRVLQAAASAAHQSRRKQIDGAIVLAAIVGDAKSPAAGLLKAHGMTFEEAIRALQRANTQARLKPAPKAAAPSAASEQAQGSSPPDAAPPDGLESADEFAAPEAPSPQAQAPQAAVADEILAAARARILQRAAAAAARADNPLLNSIPAPSEPASLHADFPEASPTPAPAYPSGPPAHEEAPPPAAPPPPPPEPAHGMPRPRWTPPPEPRPQPPPGRLAQQPGGRPAAPFPSRPLQPGEGPPRPPLPQRAGTGRPPPRHAGRPAAAPWPDPSELGPPRPGLPNGSMPAAGPAPGPRAVGQPERGPLIENVPRRMRVGVAATAEVRIARDRIEGLIMALNGSGMARRPDAFITRALSVRLRAPSGGFYIEPASPETQWVEASSALIQDDYAIWRWTVTPQRRGRRRLVLGVSARTVGPDGVAAESAPPDRLIEVRVRANQARRIVRWTALIGVLLLGAALGSFGQDLWHEGLAAMQKVLNGYL